ncbi:MAG: hypothetical protein Q7T80_03800 [Methanoregula sp.]|nr:hypothetical protein [Methanoregula sp.]
MININDNPISIILAIIIVLIVGAVLTTIAIPAFAGVGILLLGFGILLLVAFGIAAVKTAGNF